MAFPFKKHTNHKCILEDGSIVEFDASSQENTAPAGRNYKSLGLGQYHSLVVDGKTVSMTGKAYFFKLTKTRKKSS